MTIPLKWQRLADIEGEFPQAVEDNFLQIAQQFPLPPTSTHYQRAPQARVYSSVNQTTTTGATPVVTFNSERYDMVPAGVSEQHSTSANTSRLTCRVPGLYSIGGMVEWASAAGGIREIAIMLNGATLLANTTANAASAVQSQAVQTQYRLVVGDYVELRAFQNSGGNLDIRASGNYSPEFAFHWISP